MPLWHTLKNNPRGNYLKEMPWWQILKERNEILGKLWQNDTKVNFGIKAFMMKYERNTLAVDYEETTSMANPTRKAFMAYSGCVALVVCSRRLSVRNHEGSFYDKLYAKYSVHSVWLLNINGEISKYDSYVWILW